MLVVHGGDSGGGDADGGARAADGPRTTVPAGDTWQIWITGGPAPQPLAAGCCSGAVAAVPV
jgi:hypothetical protein